MRGGERRCIWRLGLRIDLTEMHVRESFEESVDAGARIDRWFRGMIGGRGCFVRSRQGLFVATFQIVQVVKPVGSVAAVSREQ